MNTLYLLSLLKLAFYFDTKQVHAAGVTVKCEGGSEGGRG